jgi:hypothetical protein
VKSLSETHPDCGFASGPVEFHWYVDGRVHVAVDTAVFELARVVREVETIVELGEVPPLPVHGRH